MWQYIVILFVAIASSLLGLMIGDYFLNQALAGSVEGLLSGAFLGLAIVSRRRRWLAMSGLMVALGGTYFLGGWTGAVIGLGITLTAMFVMAAVTRDLYGGSEWDAFLAHLLILIGRIRGFQIIAEGKTVWPSGAKGPLLGPRLVIVRPYNAVILEQGSKQTGTKGPAVLLTEPFEYVADIFNLEPDQRQLYVEDVLTKDGAEVDVYLLAPL